MRFVYFIATADRTRVKIGVAMQPLRRLQQLQTGMADDIDILAVEAGDWERERELHARFSELHIRGEWFALKGALSEYIGTLPPFIRQRKRGCGELSRRTGWSRSYCSELLNGHRKMTMDKALFILAQTGWRLGPIADATDDEAAVLVRFAPAAESAAA